jgi:phosphate transport system protein
MAIHLFREIEKLKKMILSLAALVEENVRLAVKAVAQRDEKMAVQAIENDHQIDLTEVTVEEECLKILALHQPVANDLRYIVGMMKINHDLERIGDLAVSIGQRAFELTKAPRPRLDFDILNMAEKVQTMVGKSIDALINRDAQLARAVWFSDDEIDRRNEDTYRSVEAEIRAHPEHLVGLMNLLSVSRNLERIADHATNIAKDVIYMFEGEIVRHRSREFRKQAEAT